MFVCLSDQLLLLNYMADLDETWHGYSMRPGSNVQNIPGIFQKLPHKSAAAHGQNIRGIFLCMQLFVMILFHCFNEYSRNILQVRPRPEPP